MHAIAIVLSIITVAAFVASAVPKLSGNATVVANLQRLHVTRGGVPRIGGIELAGAAGLLIGIIWAGWLAALAACGLTILMAIAVTMHRSARDRTADAGAAIAYLVLSALTFLTLLLS